MKKSRIIIYGGIFAVFIGLLANWMFESLVHTRREVDVPNVVGKTLFETLELLEPLNLGLRKVAVEFDKNLPTGVVVRQNPPAAMRVREGRIVRVTVAVGAESVFVPTLEGLNLRQAEIKIRAAALILGEITKNYSLKYPGEYVIKQFPSPGSRVSKETIASLVISGGAPPSDITLLPDFAGQTADKVDSWSRETGATVEYLFEDNFKFVGKVIRQSPDFDTVVEPGAVVSVVVGK
ncbi:MAG: PASTA domain-containing protein [Endomicrobiia bacterium]|nr:PASTA domain-containing protein [Endomicrobiia bacterium]